MALGALKQGLDRLHLAPLSPFFLPPMWGHTVSPQKNPSSSCHLGSSQQLSPQSSPAGSCILELLLSGAVGNKLLLLRVTYLRYSITVEHTYFSKSFLIAQIPGHYTARGGNSPGTQKMHPSGCGHKIRLHYNNCCWNYFSCTKYNVINVT